MDGIRLYSFQLMLLTIFLAALSWSFYARLRKQEFFGWWVWAWTSFAAFATLGTASLHLPEESTLLRGGLLLLATLFGFLQAPLLVFAGASLRTPGSPTPGLRRVGIGLALAAAVVALAVSGRASHPLVSFSLRHAPRALALAGALLFCAWVFLRHARTASSRGGAVTATFCVIYALTQGVYVTAMVGVVASGGPGPFPHPLLDLSGLVRSPLVLLDLLSACGIALGMALLLVEEHRHSEDALALSVTRSREIAERNLALEEEIAERQRVETALRSAEAALRESQARHRAILAALPDLMFLQTREGVYVEYHGDPRQLVAKPEEFLGRNMADVLPPALAAQFRPLFARAVESGGPCELEYAVPVNGDLRQFEARLVRCSDNVLSIVRDVTERRRAEGEARELREELAHVGRVSLLGALTGSLAHEINQPLTAVLANAQAALRLLTRTRPDLHELGRILEDIVADNRRAGDVLQRLRNFLSKGPPERASLDLNTTVEEVVRLVGSDILGRRVSLEVQLEPRAPAVLGDRVQLQQVVLNLLMNAFDAMEDVEVGARRVVLRTAGTDDLAVVSVVDHGVGVPDDRLARIFEPFYTTKAGGMGLGLPMCRAIVEAHGGELRAERNPEGGMKFLFSLPVSRPGNAFARAES